MTLRMLLAATILATGSILTAATAPLTAGPDKPAVKPLVAAVQTYVAELQAKLAYGVFDEVYDQHANDEGVKSDRQIRGELFLTFLPEDEEWIAVHDFAEVDGHPVADHQALASLLDRGSLQNVGRTVADRNAQYNIGGIPRNFNEPTFALLVLQPKRVMDFEFSVDKVEDDGTGVPLATLGYHERAIVDVPLVHSPGGEQVHATGYLVVEVQTGRIRETQFSLKPKGMSATLTTRYAYDDPSNLWLPSVFDERYESKSPKALVTCESHYSNFRRFEVLGRIK